MTHDFKFSNDIGIISLSPDGHKLLVQATISKAHFLADSTTVIFVGNQIRPNETGVFKWSAAKP